MEIVSRPIRKIIVMDTDGWRINLRLDGSYYRGRLILKIKKLYLNYPIDIGKYYILTRK